MGSSGRAHEVELDGDGWASPPASAYLPPPPFPLRRLRFDGTDVAYVEAGHGPPLVFIHGLTASLDSWQHNLAHFARRHRVVALDLPGFGRSGRPPAADGPHAPGWAGAYTPAYFARAVLALCDALGLARPSLVGNSMGGQIAMKLALMHPDRVDRLVLVDPAGASVPPRWLRQAVAVAARSRLVTLPVVPERLWALAFRRVFPNHPALVAEFARRYRQASLHPDYGAAVRVALKAYAGVLHGDLRQACAALRAPTLIVWGRRDGLLGIGGAHRLRRGIPGSLLLMYEESGHCPMIDQPERFNRDVAQFLDGQTPAEAR